MEITLDKQVVRHRCPAWALAAVVELLSLLGNRALPGRYEVDGVTKTWDTDTDNPHFPTTGG